MNECDCELQPVTDRMVEMFKRMNPLPKIDVHARHMKFEGKPSGTFNELATVGIHITKDMVAYYDVTWESVVKAYLYDEPLILREQSLVTEMEAV